MNFLKKKPDATERKKQIKSTGKEANRTIDKGKREIDKEIRDLDRQEKDATAKLKKAHVKGQEAEVRSLAKQIAQIRKTRDRMHQTNSQLSSIKAQNTSMVSSAVVVETMGVATKAMGTVNEMMSPQQTAQVMNQFVREVDKMNVTQETWEDIMDDFDGEEVDTEADDIVNQLMDEAGLTVAGAMGSVPSSRKGIGQKVDQEDEKIEKEMEELLAGLTKTPA